MRIILFIILASITLNSTYARSRCEKKLDIAMNHFSDGRRAYRDGGKVYKLAKKEMERFWQNKELICEYLHKTLYTYMRSAKAFDRSYSTYDSATDSCRGRNFNDAMENREAAGENVDHLYNYMSIVKKNIESMNCTN